jgi:hypothetical protein
VVPLSALLARAFLDLIRQFEGHGAGAGERVSFLVWANCLRVTPDEGISVTDFPAAARVSRRAVKPWLGLEKMGLLHVQAIAPRVKVVNLTTVGRRQRDRWRDVVVTAEEEWCTKVGTTRAKSLRAALEAFVSRLELELPHYPMTYGAADPSALGGRRVAAKRGPPRIPAHGIDWVPVVRIDNDTVSDLPLHALLSQALMAFTIEYEENAHFPMAIAAKLATMPSSAVLMHDLPEALGVNGSGKSFLERHGFVRVTNNNKKRLASLTPTGLRVREAYQPTVSTVAHGLRRSYGEAIIDELVACLTSVDTQLDDGLPDCVLIRFVPGVGFADVSLSFMPSQWSRPAVLEK